MVRNQITSGHVLAPTPLVEVELRFGGPANPDSTPTNGVGTSWMVFLTLVTNVGTTPTSGVGAQFLLRTYGPDHLARAFAR